jgi:hypothetical protein
MFFEIEEPTLVSAGNKDSSADQKATSVDKTSTKNKKPTLTIVK